jgi:Zn-dependent protease
MSGARELRLGRIHGIEIAIDRSWIFIVLLMSWSLASAFAHWHPLWKSFTTIATAIASSLLFFGSVLLHELAHSLVAQRYGVPVTRITLFLFGGISNMEREPPSAGAEFWTAVVGPLTSIALGLVLLAIGSAVTHVPGDVLRDPGADLARLSPAATLLMWLGPINIVVGAFNLLPGFPLDGGRILRAAIWGATRNLHLATRLASFIGQALGWAMILAGVAVVFGANVPYVGRGVASGLWLAFIGWFLSSAASQTWRRQLVREVLEGLTVSRLMAAPPPVVRLRENLSSVIAGVMMRSPDRAFPVVDDGGEFVGLLTFEDVRKAHASAFHGVRDDQVFAKTEVSRVMTPRDQLVVASPREDLGDAADKMARADVSQLPILDAGDHLVGMLLRRDVLRWIELHVRQGARHYAH